MENLDIKTTLKTTLEQKQELVRDYQTFADEINDDEIAKMYKHFAEAEALHATKIRDTLQKWQ